MARAVTPNKAIAARADKNSIQKPITGLLLTLTISAPSVHAKTHSGYAKNAYDTLAVQRDTLVDAGPWEAESRRCRLRACLEGKETSFNEGQALEASGEQRRR